MELIAYIALSFFQNHSALPTFVDFFFSPQIIIIAAAMEETLKLTIISKQIEKFSIEKDLIYNSILVGTGFFAVEVFLLALSSSPLPHPQHILEIALLHAGTAGLFGGYIALTGARKIPSLFLIAAVAISLHASYNYLAIERSYVQNCLIYAILTVIAISNAASLLKTRKDAENW